MVQQDGGIITVAAEDVSGHWGADGYTKKVRAAPMKFASLNGARSFLRECNSYDRLPTLIGSSASFKERVRKLVKQKPVERPE